MHPLGGAEVTVQMASTPQFLSPAKSEFALREEFGDLVEMRMESAQETAARRVVDPVHGDHAQPVALVAWARDKPAGESDQLDVLWSMFEERGAGAFLAGTSVEPEPMVVVQIVPGDDDGPEDPAVVRGEESAQDVPAMLAAFGATVWDRLPADEIEVGAQASQPVGTWQTLPETRFRSLLPADSGPLTGARFPRSPGDATSPAQVEGGDVPAGPSVMPVTVGAFGRAAAVLEHELKLPVATAFAAVEFLRSPATAEIGTLHGDLQGKPQQSAMTPDRRQEHQVGHLQIVLAPAQGDLQANAVPTESLARAEPWPGGRPEDGSFERASVSVQPLGPNVPWGSHDPAAVLPRDTPRLERRAAVEPISPPAFEDTPVGNRADHARKNEATNRAEGSTAGVAAVSVQIHSLCSGVSAPLDVLSHQAQADEIPSSAVRTSPHFAPLVATGTDHGPSSDAKPGRARHEAAANPFQGFVLGADPAPVEAGGARPEPPPPAVTPGGLSSRPDVGQAVSQQVAVALSLVGEGQIELALDPEELGPVRLSLSAVDTGVTVYLNADRGETLDLLRRNADALIRELQSAGYSQVSLSFGSEGPPNGRHPTRADVSRDRSVDAIQDQVSPAPRGPGLRSGTLDMRL